MKKLFLQISSQKSPKKRCRYFDGDIIYLRYDDIFYVYDICAIWKR